METTGRYCLPVHPRPAIVHERPVRIAFAVMLTAMAFNAIVSHHAGLSHRFLRAFADVAAVCGATAYLLTIGWIAYERRHD